MACLTGPRGILTIQEGRARERPRNHGMGSTVFSCVELAIGWP